MSGLPSGIEVSRYVPEHLVQEYLDGILTLWGGELRRKNGSIAGFLTEGSTLIQRVNEGLPIQPSQLMQAVGNAEFAAHLATGIGVVNLGVQVAGFAIVARRLDRIALQVEVVRDELRAVGEGVEWLKQNALTGLRSDVAHALAVAERAARREASALFDEAKSKSDRARRHIINLLEDMAAPDRMLPQHRLFAEFVKMGVLLANCEAHCDVVIEGPEQAAKDLKAAIALIRKPVEHFVATTRNFRSAPLALLRVGDCGRAAVKDTARETTILLERIEGHIPQLQLQSLLGLGSGGWQKLVEPEEGDALLCLTFSGSEGDNLSRKLARARTCD